MAGAWLFVMTRQPARADGQQCAEVVDLEWDLSAGEVEIELRTELPDGLEVQPGPYMVPCMSSRLHLSDLVNRLLCDDERPYTQFAFLVEGSPLRGTLEGFMVARQHTAERLPLRVKYLLFTTCQCADCRAVTAGQGPGVETALARGTGGAVSAVPSAVVDLLSPRRAPASWDVTRDDGGGTAGCRLAPQRKRARLEKGIDGGMEKGSLVAPSGAAGIAHPQELRLGLGSSGASKVVKGSGKRIEEGCSSDDDGTLAALVACLD
jgi:hypothetical protein